VALCLTRDEHNINFQPGGLPFAELEAAGGRVTVVADRLMHHKFCVLDGRDVLTGSYNWTHRAAHHNEENLVLTTTPSWPGTSCVSLPASPGSPKHRPPTRPCSGSSSAWPSFSRC